MNECRNFEASPKARPPFFAGVLDAETLGEIEKRPQGDLAKAAAECSAIEIRYDLFLSAGFPAESLGKIAARVLNALPKALLMGTIRLKRDGGTFPDEGSLSRAELFRSILRESVHPDYIDIEAEEFVSLESEIRNVWTRECGGKIPLLDETSKKILVSHHDFQKVPAIGELDRLRACAAEWKCAGFKVACMSASEGDFDSVYPWIKSVADGSWRFALISCFAMGKTGESSRIGSLEFGANLTYCSLGKAVAPGQIPIREAREAYRNRISKV